MENKDKVLNAISNGREYRDLKVEIIETNEENQEQDYQVKGYASTYDEPYHLYTIKASDGYAIEVREQVDRKAFDNADMSDVIMQYDHMGRVFARISNGTLALNKDDEHGLFMNAYLGGTEIGRQLYEEIKGGYTSKMSFGFIVEDDKLEQIDATTEGEVWLRTITDISKVFDVSAVSLPANDYTSISARHYCDGVIATVEAERLQRAQQEAERLQREAKINELELRIKALKGE